MFWAQSLFGETCSSISIEFPFTILAFYITPYMCVACFDLRYGEKLRKYLFRAMRF